MNLKKMRLKITILLLLVSGVVQNAAASWYCPQWLTTVKKSFQLCSQKTQLILATACGLVTIGALYSCNQKRQYAARIKPLNGLINRQVALNTNLVEIKEWLTDYENRVDLSGLQAYQAMLQALVDKTNALNEILSFEQQTELANRLNTMLDVNQQNTRDEAMFNFALWLNDQINLCLETYTQLLITKSKIR